MLGWTREAMVVDKLILSVASSCRKYPFQLPPASFVNFQQNWERHGHRKCLYLRIVKMLLPYLQLKGGIQKKTTTYHKYHRCRITLNIQRYKIYEYQGAP